MKTFSAKPAEVTHEWFVIDATDKVLGRVASEVALTPARQAQSHLHASRRYR
jgi:ribosomal protein L13